MTPSSTHKFTIDWLNNNPLKWTGRTVQSKKSGAIYTIREVLRSGSVVLEKGSAVLPSSVKTIRQDFESACP